jgi:flagellar basal-body rod protein FlgG
MTRGLYTAYTGMYNEQKRLDIITNNLANSATIGYKEEQVTSQAFKELLFYKIKDRSTGFVDEPIGNMSLGVKIGETYTNWDQGSLRQTENTYDVAIEGNGFFTVRVTNANGEDKTYYTRNGTFNCTTDGYIVDSDGNHIQGSSGDLQVPTDAANIVIDQDGAIYADDVYVDTIQITDFEDYNYLKQYGDNFWEAVDGATTKEGSYTLEQGYTEQSNVNVIDQMVDMITITRAYEAGQKMIQTQDSLLSQSVSQVGKVG